MRLLQLHAEFMEYEPVEEELNDAEKNIVKSKIRLESLIVVFVSVEKGDNKITIEKAIEEIKSYSENLKVNRLLIYPYSHLSSYLESPKNAFEIIKELETKSRKILTEVNRAPFGWTKSFNIKVKGHPLAENFKVISNIQFPFIKGKDEISRKDDLKQHMLDMEPVSSALNSEEKQQSLWFILDTNGVLTPLEGFKIEKNSNLKKFLDYETSKRRAVDQQPPHVGLMKKMAIADYEPASDAGNMRYYPKGKLMKSLIEQFVTRNVLEYGGIEVETPIMYDTKHPSMESYFNRFPARQYNIVSDNKQLFLRFAACFGQFLMAKDFHITYKNLPLKLYELTRYSFRREKSGELVGLRRLRAFSMPDCHAFCKDIEQAKDECLKRFDLSLNVLNGFDIKIDDIEMAIRFTETFYNENKEFVAEISRKFGKPILVEMWKDRFFYFIFKWEFNYVDSLGKAAALSTDQIDVENGKRYKIEYIDEQGKRKNPIILHNSPSGAIERIIYTLLEKAAKIKQQGERPQFPIWLSHTQVRIIPIKNEHLLFAENVENILSQSHIRTDIDDRQESLSKRIREAETEWIPYIIVIGDKEAKSTILVIRDRKTGKQIESNIEELIESVRNEIRDKPFMPLNLPKYLSKRPQIMV
ncbi:MAG TPA: threonine--tRNA ligase [Nitrososphaeraceae archaeon]|nr:threonine--tRNA ligase [Nitrososphaeraceae archaeon]